MKILVHFFIGLAVGWILEFVFRSWQNKKFVWPHVLSFQMYGWTAVLLHLLGLSSLVLFYKIPLIFLVPSMLELIFGYGYLKIMKRRLWDYSDKPINIMGIVCLEFSFYWFALSLVYYLYVLPLYP